MKNGWTGGQYSLLRVVLGLGLLCGLLAPLWWTPSTGYRDEGVGMVLPGLRALLPAWWWLEGAAITSAFAALGAVAALSMVVGWHDRPAAALSWLALAVLCSRLPLLSMGSQLLVGWALLAHSLSPAAPYGSLAARGRVDPAGDWRMPPGLFAASWGLLLLALASTSLLELRELGWAQDQVGPLRAGGWGLHLLAAPLAIARRVRPWLWLTLLLAQLLFLTLGMPQASLGVLVVLLVCFDPGWVSGRGGAELLFYDGGCGLCHRAVRFLIAEGPDDHELRFAALGGSTFSQLVPESQHGALPDSIVLLTASGELLTRSTAVLSLGRRLGGLWRLLSSAASIVPRRLLDTGYDLIAGVRKRVFAPPEGLCPILPPELRRRFDP